METKTRMETGCYKLLLLLLLTYLGRLSHESLSAIITAFTLDFKVFVSCVVVVAHKCQTIYHLCKTKLIDNNSQQLVSDFKPQRQKGIKCRGMAYLWINLFINLILVHVENVGTHVTAVSETSFTDRTDVWLFTCMQLHVLFQVAATSESSFTDLCSINLHIYIK